MNLGREAVLTHLGRAADLIVVLADEHMADGSVIGWELLRPATREAYLDIAAAIVRRFSTVPSLLGLSADVGPGMEVGTKGGTEPGRVPSMSPSSLPGMASGMRASLTALSA